MPIYKVQAPNGKVYRIEGPENADQNVLFQTANQLYEQDENKRLRKEYGPGILGTLGEGAVRGAQQLGVLGGDIIPAMVGQAFGFEDYAKRQMEEAAQTQQEIQAARPPIFESYKEVESPYQAIQFGAEVIGEQLANIATSLIPGLGVGAIAGRSALTSVGKSLATQAAERGLAGEAATVFVAEGMKRAAPQIAAKSQLGTDVGIFLGSYAQNAPEVFQNVFQETGQMDVGTSMLFGAGAAALDSVLPAQLARQITGPLKVGIVEKVLEKSGMDRGLLRSVTSGMLKGVAGEGLTEGAQEAISIAAEKFVGENPQVFESKEWDRIMESSVRGAIAGGGFGGVGGSVQRMREAAVRKAQMADAMERRGERQEAARLRKEVIAAEQEIAEIEARQEQGQLPGMETGIYSSLYQPQEVVKKAKKGAKDTLTGKQLEMFGPQGELTKAVEKAATADEKRAVVVARQQAQREVAEQKANQEKLKKFLSAKQLTLPGMSPEELAAAQQQQAAVKAQAVATGQGDLFAAPPAPAVAPAPAVIPEPTKVTPPSGLEGTIISSDKGGLTALGKQLGIGRTAKILRPDGPLAGKDLSDPAQAAEVRRILEVYASGKPAEGATAKIEEFLKRPEFQVAETEVTPDERVDTELVGGAVEPSVPSDITGREAVGDLGAPGVGAPVVGGLGEAGLPAERPAEGAGVVEPALGVKAAKDVAKAEAATGEAIQRQADFITQNDERANNALTGMLREAAANADIDPDLLPSEDLTGTPAHNYLRLPGLLNEYFRLKDVLARPALDPAGQAQDARNQQELDVIRDAILQSGPDMGPFLQEMEAATPKQRNSVLSNITKEAKTEFQSVIEEKIAQAQQAGVPAAVEKPAAPATPEQASRLEKIAAAAQRLKQPSREEFISEVDSEKARKAQKAFAEDYEKLTGEKLFLPVHRGPNLNADGRALVESGDLKSLIDHLRDASTSKPLRMILAKVKSLNLKTKIIVGNPEGEMGLSARTRKIENWFEGIEETAVTPYKGKNKLVQMPIDEFLLLAERDTPTSRSDKVSRVQKIIEENGKFSGTPWLSIEVDANGRARVTGHEGRHRARALKALGHSVIPVELRTNIRWSEQQDPEKFDYKQNWPTTLIGQEGDVVSFPVSREEADSQYTPIADTSAVEDAKLYQNKAGSFDPRTNTITIDPNLGMNEHTVLHEIMHAAISHVLRNPNLPVTKQLTALFEQLQNQLGAAYGASDIQEFAAELVSNPEFQALLKTMKAPKSQNMFVRFMQTLAEFFGFAKGTNAYDKGLKLISDALDISTDVEPSAAGLMFLGTPNGASTGFGVVGQIGRAMPSLTGRTIDATRNYLSNMPTDVRSIAMGVLRLDNINEIYKRDLPSLQNLIDALEMRSGMQEQRIKKVNDNYTRFLEVERKNPQAMQRMNDMAYDARLEQVDLLDPKFQPSPAQQAEYRRLKGIYSSLPASVQQVYKDIRADYDASINEYEDILLNSVQDPSMRRKLKAQYEARKRQIGYIPFLRRGDFWVEYDENGERAVQAFQSQRERQIFINTQLKGKPYKAYQNIDEAVFNQGTLPSSSFIVGLMNQLNKQGASEELKRNIYQSYLALFPAESLAKNFMKSDNVRGMERDIVRGYGETMIKWARKLSASKYNPTIDRALSEVATQGETASTKPGGEGAFSAAQNVLSQANFFHNPTYGSLVSAATTISYFNYIAGNISSALVNLTTLPMFSWSILGAKFGFDKSSSALLDASKTTINYIFNNRIPPKYARLFDALNDHAQLEHTVAREVLEGRRQTTSDYIGLKARIMDGISIPFAKAEVLNRGATAIAAYDLARGSGMNEQDAIRYAINTTKQINTSGLGATAPRYMQHPVGRVFFTFKSFIWNSAYVVGRAFHQAFKGETPQVQREARRQLLGIYGMTMAFAGIKGLPFMGAVSTLAEIIASLFGDEDEPFDFNTEMRAFFGDLFYKGGINYALNLEIANRVGVANDLLFRDDPRSVDEHGYVLTAMQQMFGPLGSFVVGVGRGAELVGEGEVWRGVESMMPTFVKNAMKGFRYYQDGVTNLKGEPIIEDISAYNIAMQLIGFSPANLSNVYEELSMKKGFERDVLKRRSQLLNKYDMARRVGDYDLMMETQEAIDKFNERRIDSKAKITRETLLRSQRAREAAEKNVINGVRFNKSLMPEIERLLDEDED